MCGGVLSIAEAVGEAGIRLRQVGRRDQEEATPEAEVASAASQRHGSSIIQALCRPALCAARQIDERHFTPSPKPFRSRSSQSRHLLTTRTLNHRECESISPALPKGSTLGFSAYRAAPSAGV